MKVLIVSTYERTGGAAVAASRLLHALKGAGVDVKMLVSKKTTDNQDVMALSRFRAVLLRLAFVCERLVVFVANRFRRVGLFDYDVAMFGGDITGLRAFQEADIIHLHWINQGMLSLHTIEGILKSGKPVVWTMHDMWQIVALCHNNRNCPAYNDSCNAGCRLNNRLAESVFERKQRLYSSWRNSLSFVACSDWLMRLALRSKLLSENKICTIPNPIDTNIFHKRNKHTVRDILHLPQDKKIVLFCAFDVTNQYKGVNYFYEACDYLTSNYDVRDLIVVVLGKNSDIIRQNIALEVYSLGYISGEEKIAEVYSAADVYVTPSLEDNLPNTVMEALACGTPCVGFDVGGIPEMVDHKHNGYIADFRNARELADGIYWTLYTSDFTQLSDNAIAKVRNEYSEQSVARRYIEVYQSMM